jgi:hypothetical protein
MKTLPTPISTGLSSNLAQFWLVKVEGSAATYYWTTQTKNLTAQTLILKDATAIVTADSGVIAKVIDGDDQVGISQIEFGVDISQGGAISSAADVEIDILNQDRKDTTILATPNRLEYRPVTVYMGYIPAGVSPTVEITLDMLQMWTGVVDDVLDFDYGHFALKCTDGVFLRHKDIPTTVIDSTAYPYAPEENLGKPLPDIYGDFYPASATALKAALLYETVNPAPSIMTDEPGKVFHFAGHVLHTAPVGDYTAFTSPDAIYIYDRGMNVHAPFVNYAAGIIAVTNTGTAYITFPTGALVADYYFQVKGKGVLTTASITDFQKVCDKDSSSSTLMSNTTGRIDLYLRVLKTPSQTQDYVGGVNYEWMVDLGDIQAGFTGTLKYKKDGGALTSSGVTFTNTNSNTLVRTGALAADDFSKVNLYQFGVAATGSEYGLIKNISLYFAGVIIANLTEFRDQASREPEPDFERIGFGFRGIKGPRPIDWHNPPIT